jgi:uncharacterized SAM-binding protein YcdF (DUF218 family)
VRRVALSAWILSLAAVAAFLFWTPAGARAWLACMEDRSPPPGKEQALGAQAIVVLGGNRDRVHEAARLHSLTGLPILLAGRGTGDWPYEAESEKMAWMLRTQHGIEPRWVEKRSMNTHENAVESWCLLNPHGLKRIVLVTGAQHMRRARYEFRQAGFVVVSDPVVETTPWPPLGARDFVPGAAGLRSVGRALGEYRDLAFGFVEDLADGAPHCGAGAAAG